MPNDGQQGDRVALWMHSKLHAKKVYIIDDETSYSQGLAIQVAKDLKDSIAFKRNKVNQTVSDFSPYVTAVKSYKPQIVYIPWQLADKAQLFYNQLHAGGYTGIVFGSDGVDAPATFQPNGHGYVSGFPVDFSNPALTKFANSHSHDTETAFRRTRRSWSTPRRSRPRARPAMDIPPRLAVRKAVAKVSVVEGLVSARVPGQLPEGELDVLEVRGRRRHGRHGGFRHLPGSRQRELQAGRLTA